MANVFLLFYDVKWLEECPKEFKPDLWRVEKIHVLHELEEHSRNLVIVLIHVIQTCLFLLNKKENGKLSFLDMEVAHGKGLLLVLCTLSSKCFCQQYTNLVWFILFLAVVSKFILIVQSFKENFVVWNKSF